MPNSTTPRDVQKVEEQVQPTLEWVTPEVTKLDLETAQQTGIPG